MSFRQLQTWIKANIPSPLKKSLRAYKAREQLKSVQRENCTTQNLRCKSKVSLDELFQSDEIEKMWLDFENEIKNDDILNVVTDKSVNAGDQRAIFYLISAFAPASVLEVGTHMGGSMLSIAAALNKVHQGNLENVNLTTVDIIDVNSSTDKPWETYGMPCSPKGMVERAGFNDFVHFVSGPSLNYATQCKRTFDFIFLDGSHAATTVYQEIPIMLKILSKNGVIMLHDYFPGGKPLCSDGKVIPGPIVATEKLRQEGLDITVYPLGALPWETKPGSNYTSLALLLKDY